jgi:hypothetical protein
MTLRPVASLAGVRVHDDDDRVLLEAEVHRGLARQQVDQALRPSLEEQLPGDDEVLVQNSDRL